MAKYDWKQLEKEYILSDYKSVRDFCNSIGLNYNGNTQQKTKGWNNLKQEKELQKSCKTVAKVIEKEAEKEAQQIVDIKSIANDLALNIIKANSQLEQYIVKNKKKTKQVKYDYQVGKPKEEVIDEKEEIEVLTGIIDRQGLKMLTSALKDLNEIIGQKQEENPSLEKLDEVLKNIGGVV